MFFTSKRVSFPISTRKAPSESTVLREAERKDLPFIRELARSFAAFGPYEEIVPLWFSDRLVKTFVLEREKARLGFFMLGLLFPSWLSPTLDLMAIAVVPEERKKGLGKMMVKEALRWARKRGYRFLRAHVGCQNEPALLLFKNSGFRVKKKIEGYYPSGLTAYELVASL